MMVSLYFVSLYFASLYFACKLCSVVYVQFVSNNCKVLGLPRHSAPILLVRVNNTCHMHVICDSVESVTTHQCCIHRQHFNMPRPIIAPSVLASDLGNLSAECKRMMEEGAE